MADIAATNMTIEISATESDYNDNTFAWKNEKFVILNSSDNLDEQLGGVAVNVIIKATEHCGKQEISKHMVEERIKKERIVRKLIADGYNPINLRCTDSGLCQNSADMKLVVFPGFDAYAARILENTIIAEFHNNCLPLIKNYMSAPENNTYSFKHCGWQYSFKFYWPEVATNKICFIGRNADYKDMYSRCPIVEALVYYHTYSHIDDTGMLVVNDYDYSRGKVSDIDPFDKAAFDSGLETLGTLAHKKSFEDFISGMKSGVEKFMLQLGGYKYKEYFKYVKTAYDNDYIFCFCETLPDVVVADTPEFTDWYANYIHNGFRPNEKDKTIVAQIKERVEKKDVSDGYYTKYLEFINRVGPLAHIFMTKEKFPNDYAEYFKKVKGPGKYGTCLDLSTPKAVRDALPTVKKYCKCVLADRAYLTNIRFPAPDDRDVDYRGRPRNGDKINDLRWHQLYIARDDTTDSTLACATVYLTTLSALNPGLINPDQPPIIQLLATGKYKKNTGRDLVPLGGQIPVTSVVDLSKVRATKAALGYF